MVYFLKFFHGGFSVCVEIFTIFFNPSLIIYLVCAHVFLVPLCYIKIWMFLKRQNRKIAGKVLDKEYVSSLS